VLQPDAAPPGATSQRDPLRPADAGGGSAPNRLQPPAPAAPPPAGQPAPPSPAADPDQLPDEVLVITGTVGDATALAQQLAAQGYTVRALQDLPMLGFAVFVGVALAWLVPDRRMERALAQPRPPSD